MTAGSPTLTERSISTITGEPGVGTRPVRSQAGRLAEPDREGISLDIRGAGLARTGTRSRRPKLGQISVEETYVYAA